VASRTDALPFERSLGPLISPATARLEAGLSSIPGLGPADARAVLAGAETGLRRSLHRKVARLLLLELNAARVEGRLAGDTPEARWDHFIETTESPGFWEELEAHYPTLMPRVRRLVANQADSALLFARRWAADKQRLDRLLGGPAGALTEVAFGAGDTHNGGLTVAIVDCEGGRIVYKPRSVAADLALGEFIAELCADLGETLPIRVADTLGFEDHGWAAFIEHRYAADRTELGRFYAGIGQWLAVMRLLGGTDMHAENLIASGGSPVVVDCETLFTPDIPPAPTGFGDAGDRAERLMAGTVLTSGLLPGRGQGLGWRGIDTSAVGSLPGQQPMMLAPDIVGVGTDEAKMATTAVPVAPSQNHPTAEPALADFWPEVLAGFERLSNHLRGLDARGELRSRLARFEDCPLRVVVRQTEVYAELMRMLWHPVSLHKEEEARERARDLLAQMGANVATAPSDPAVIAAEVEELMIGEIPYFSTVAREGALTGPAGTRWLEPCHRVDEAWQSWREADLELERSYIRMALVSAYVNEGWMPDPDTSFWPAEPTPGDLDRRRREQAAAIMARLRDAAIFGDDGTATWIAPTLEPTGWSVRPLDPDLYGGLSGLALLTGAYLRETEAGRADPVEGLESLFQAIDASLEAGEKTQLDSLESGKLVRPPAPGAYLGLGSRIWTRLVLSKWGLDDGSALERAARLGRQLPRAAASEEINDLLAGKAGAIPAFLALARCTGDPAWLEMARAVGDSLCEAAQPQAQGVLWLDPRFPVGLGGFAHGVSGVGWALFQLAEATGDPRYRETAEAAFAFEDSLFLEDAQNWRDLREMGLPTAAAWCHGSVGIGLARLDLDPELTDPATRRTLRAAADATRRTGLGWNHTACHGDLGAWEILDRAIALGEGPEGLARESMMASMLTSIEEHGPVWGIVRKAFSPGLMAGAGGIAYQLLRWHPESDLPSILTLGGSRYWQ
jgi:type 2 lantibiotic biosynthesis protein LanM